MSNMLVKVKVTFKIGDQRRNNTIQREHNSLEAQLKKENIGYHQGNWICYQVDNRRFCMLSNSCNKASNPRGRLA